VIPWLLNGGSGFPGWRHALLRLCWWCLCCWNEIVGECVEGGRGGTASCRHSGVRFVVTASLDSGLAAKPFTALQLQDMDDDTIGRFLQVYCRQVERAETRKRATLRSSRRARGRPPDRGGVASERRSAPTGGQSAAVDALILVTGQWPAPHAGGGLRRGVHGLGRTWRSARGSRGGPARRGDPDDLADELGAWMHQHRPRASHQTRAAAGARPFWRHTTAPSGIRRVDRGRPLGSEAGRGVLEFVRRPYHTGLLSSGRRAGTASRT